MNMVGSFGARDYFILHNEKAINDMKDRIKADAEPGCAPQGRGLPNAAKAKAWEECENKEKYEEMAQNHDPQLYVVLVTSPANSTDLHIFLIVFETAFLLFCPRP